MSNHAHAAAATIAVVVSFASLVTAHVAVVHGIASTGNRSRAAAALVIVPLAPYAAFRSGLPIRAAVWIVAALAYAVALFLAW
jgi:hypothetical protein